MSTIVALIRCVAVVVLLVISVASRAAADVCVEVDVRFAVPTTSSPLLFGSMTDEVEAIWKPYGVRIQWTEDVDMVSCPSTDWSFAVQVNDGAPPQSTARPLTLGSIWVRRLPVSRRPPIHLDYAATKRLIGSLNTNQRRHGLLGTTHQRRGLMRTTIVATELVGYRRQGFTLSAVEIARLPQRQRDLGSRAAIGDVRSVAPSACDD